MINSQRGLLENGCQLELLGSDLVVAGLDGDTKTEELQLGLGHGGEDLGRNAAKVMIVHLLVLRGQVADQGTASVLEIGAKRVEGAIDQEVLLLSSESGVDVGSAGLGTDRDGIDQVQELAGRPCDRRCGAEEDSLLVKGITVVGDEDGGDVQNRSAVRAFLDEHGRGGIPDCVSTSLEGGAHASGGEGRRIGLGLEQLGARERVNGGDLKETGVRSI